MKHYLLFLAMLPGTTQQIFAQAVILLINGKIFTADTGNLYVQALAIKGNKTGIYSTAAENCSLAKSNSRRQAAVRVANN